MPYILYKLYKLYVLYAYAVVYILRIPSTMYTTTCTTIYTLHTYSRIYATREATDVAACEKKKDTVNVAHVINFDFPLNPVDYIHRIGRTGRGGGTGRVTNLVTKVCGHM
jgi:hypothetical protein